MTSSPDHRPSIDPLPPALSSMWRLCKLGYRHEPALILVAFSLALLASLPDALVATGPRCESRSWRLGCPPPQHGSSSP